MDIKQLLRYQYRNAWKQPAKKVKFRPEKGLDWWLAKHPYRNMYDKWIAKMVNESERVFVVDDFFREAQLHGKWGYWKLNAKGKRIRRKLIDNLNAWLLEPEGEKQNGNYFNNILYRRHRFLCRWNCLADKALVKS